MFDQLFADLPLGIFRLTLPLNVSLYEVLRDGGECGLLLAQLK